MSNIYRMSEPGYLKKLQAAFQKREGLRAHTNAIRLVNGAGDGLEGLVLEQYHQHCVAQIFDERWFAQRDVLSAFVREYCGARYFIAKDRTKALSSQPEGAGGYIWISEADSKTRVYEYDVKFEVDLNDTANTGLFLDMRANRHLVSQYASGRNVLNGFAYTCSFGVHCRMRGAESVTNVDISRKILERGLRNYQLNGIEASQNEFVRFDVREYLKVAVKKNNFFDMIILDPPSFARSGKTVFRVKNSMAQLLALAFGVLNPRGVLFVATNFSAMTRIDLEEMIAAAARGRSIKNTQCVGQDVDFVGSNRRADSCLTGVLVEVG